MGTKLSYFARREGAQADPERSLGWLRLAIVLAALVPVTFLAAIAWLSYEDASADAQRRLEEIAQAAEEHAARVMERNDVVLAQMLQLLGDDDDAQVRARERQLHQVAMAILLRFPDIRSLSVWSRDGRLLVSTLFFPVPDAVHRVDWEYFRWGDIAGAGGALTRSLLVDHASGERLFRVTKRRPASGAHTGGEIELAFSPSYFNQSYRRLTEGKNGRGIALINTEGLIVGSWPPAAVGEARLQEGSRLLERMSTGAPRGTLTEDVIGAGDTRFAAFRRVGDHALFVATTQDRDAALADWQRHMLVLAAILGPITIALVLASWLVLRRTRREIETRQRLKEESRQRLLAEESLRHAQRLDALGQLAGGLAHDFNNLLAVMESSVELLARALPSAAARPELASIRRATQRGTKLTRRLLAFFRRQALQPERVAVRQALDEMLDMLRTSAGTGIAVDVDVDADTPAIEVDAAELEIALINLVANARDAMRGEGSIRIQARRARAGEGPDRHALGYGLICVSDTGEGMSAETLSRAFEPFFTTKPAGSGTGLGLSQVFGFCEQSGGAVKVSSTPHVGTTVSLFLPVSAKELPAETDADMPESESICARVLFVQLGSASGTLALILEKHGCVVTSVRSAREAERLVVAERHRFDAVLSDASAAHPEGASLVSRLHRRSPDLPVVFAGSASPAHELIGALSTAISAHQPSTQVH